MNRDEFIRWLRLDNMSISAVGAFFRGLPARTPKGNGDEAVAVRAALEARLAELNAHMLGREADTRVAVDIEEMSLQISERMDRYTSSEWDQFTDPIRQSVGEISADLRSVDPDTGSDNDPDNDPDDDSA